LKAGRPGGETAKAVIAVALTRDIQAFDPFLVAIIVFFLTSIVVFRITIAKHTKYKEAYYGHNDIKALYDKRLQIEKNWPQPHLHDHLL
jgi:hypothetical protein